MWLLLPLAQADPDPALVQACLDDPTTCEALALAWREERDANRARAVRRQACPEGDAAACVSLNKPDLACIAGDPVSCEAEFDRRRRGPDPTEALALKARCEQDERACALLEEYGWMGGWVQDFRLLEGREEGAFGDLLAAVRVSEGGLLLVQVEGQPLQLFDPSTGQRLELLEGLEPWPNSARRRGSELIAEQDGVQARASLKQLRLTDLEGQDLGAPLQGRPPFETDMQLVITPHHVIVDGRLVLDRVAEPPSPDRGGLEAALAPSESSLEELPEHPLVVLGPPSAQVALYTAGGRFPSVQGRTDASGRFEASMPRGLTEVWVWNEGGSAHQVPMLDEALELELGELDQPVVVGRVSLDGEPPGAGWVYASEDPNAARFPVGPGGGYILPLRLGGDSRRVRAETELGLSADRIVRFQPGAQIYRLDLDLLPLEDPRVLTVRLVDSRGEPLDELARVRVDELSQRTVEGEVRLLRQGPVGVEAIWGEQRHAVDVPTGPVELELRFETGSLALRTLEGEHRVLGSGGSRELAPVRAWPGARFLGPGDWRLLYWDGQRLFESELALEAGEELLVDPPQQPLGVWVRGRAVSPEGDPWIGLAWSAVAIEDLPLSSADQDASLGQLGVQEGRTRADGSFQIWLSPGQRSFRLGNRDIEVEVGATEVELGNLVLE